MAFRHKNKDLASSKHYKTAVRHFVIVCGVVTTIPKVRRFLFLSQFWQLDDEVVPKQRPLYGFMGWKTNYGH